MHEAHRACGAALEPTLLNRGNWGISQISFCWKYLSPFAKEGGQCRRSAALSPPNFQQSTLSLKQRGGFDPQPARQLEQRLHADVALAALDPADIIGVEAGAVGQFLLGQVARLA